MKMKLLDLEHSHALLCPKCGANKVAYEGVLSRPGGDAAPVFGCAACGVALLLEIESHGDRTELWWRDTVMERTWQATADDDLPVSQTARTSQ